MESPAFYPLITLITLIAAMLLLIGRWHLSPFLVLILCAWLLALFTGTDIHEITPLVMSGMGGMFGSVALVIIMGTLLALWRAWLSLFLFFVIPALFSLTACVNQSLTRGKILLH